VGTNTDSGITPLFDAGAGDDDAGPCVASCSDRVCGDDGCGGSCGSCEEREACDDDGQCVRAPPEPVVFFVFDQDLDAIYRMDDVNDDGDVLDDGEITLFFDNSVEPIGTGNSQGLFALTGDTILATDNLAPADIVRLDDRNGDGDALDDGEATVWFSGALPDGAQLQFPTGLSMGPDGAFYIYENNTLDANVGPEAIYRLSDDNNDGDVDDADKVTLFATITAQGVSETSAFDVELDVTGWAYFVDTATDDDIDRIKRVQQGGTPSVFANGATLFQLTDADEDLVLSLGSHELAVDPTTGLLLASLGAYPGGAGHLVVLSDLDGSGSIDRGDEMRIVWDEDVDDAPAMGTLREFVGFSDGSIFATDMLEDRVIRMYDDNGDGDFNDTGEVRLLYTAEGAAAAGAPELGKPFSITVVGR
jgi:hypothetical protein